MKTLGCSLVVASLIGLVVAICVPDDDSGVLEIGCWGYKECVNGVPIIHNCPDGKVFERDSMTCIFPGTGNTDCGSPSICLGKPDGLYADLRDNCETYVQCGRGIYHERFYCPLDLVFNEALQVCDYKYHVPPPCGYYQLTTTS